jgi:hypothetical protein
LQDPDQSPLHYRHFIIATSLSPLHYRHFIIRIIPITGIIALIAASLKNTLFHRWHLRLSKRIIEITEENLWPVRSSKPQQANLCVARL